MKIKENKSKIPIILLVVCSALFALPALIYIVENKTIYRFFWVWTFLLKRPETQNEKLLNTGLFFVLFTAIFIIYCVILKNNKKIFKSRKQIFILIAIISLLFLAIIPYTSTDVYSYIANGWSAAHYGENPYYTSTGQIVNNTGTIEPMFNKVANCWRYETVVYGPLWTMICTVLSWLSFGNIDIALIIFKLANLLIHIVNCILVYKITKKKLFLIMYGLNPFVLFEALTNVHNDIFIVLFILLAIYFVTRKKNLFISVSFVAMATAIKYLAILILPFIVLYAVRQKEVKDRIKCCVFCGIEYIAIILMFYLIYVKNDLTVLTGVFIQQAKYNRSIFYLIYELLGRNMQVIPIIQNTSLAVFAAYYIYVVIRILISKNIRIQEIMKKYNFILLIFTFVLITNFNPWYILWFYPTIFYLRGKSIKNILHVSYAAEMGNLVSFALWSEVQRLGITYFITMLVLTIGLNIINSGKIEIKSRRIK